MSRKLTTQEFIEKARKVHGDKYDYSKVEYVNNTSKICIICPEHGEFWQRPDKHLLGHSCPYCGGTVKLTKEVFIEKARKVHGDKYDYSKVEYVNNTTKVCITCYEHGEFWQTPHNHLKGKGCSKCAKNLPHPTKLTTEKFIERAKLVHGDKYDYSKVEYHGMVNKVCIICPIHGEFLQTPNSHLQGNGCQKCAHKINGENRRSNKDIFIEKAQQIHGNKYDYTQIKYTTAKDKVIIICKEHGEFMQAPYHHLQGCGCPICGGTKKMTTEEFIILSKQTHGNKYDYSKADYIDTHTKVCIICPEHGEFWQTPNCHLQGKGCPYCQNYKLEENISNILTKNNIIFERQKKFKWLGRQSYDFFLTEYNIAIECQGIQHFEPVGHFGGTKQFEEQKKLDAFKKQCSDLHNIKLLYYSNLDIDYPYEVYENIDDIINFIQKTDKICVNEHVIDNTKIIVNEADKPIPTSLSEYIFNLIGKDNVIVNDKNTINSLITFFIPKLNVAIIYNHLMDGFGNLYTDKNFNLLKTNTCKSKGIKTLQIFEDEYFHNRKIVENKIAHILKCQKQLPTIMGRKCVIKEISKELAKDFLTIYHIQGYTPSTVYLGAFYNDELVACMSFKKDVDRTKKLEDNAWDLTRFASNYNYICQGIGGKLFNYFKKNYIWNEIKSFADRRWTIDEENNIYLQLGFKFDSYLTPEYRYIDKSEHPLRVHKFNFRIHILHKKYGVPLTMTEREMTEYLGFTRVYDCGLIKYVYQN